MGRNNAVQTPEVHIQVAILFKLCVMDWVPVTLKRTELG